MFDSREFLNGLKRFDASAKQRLCDAVDEYGDHVLGDAQRQTPILTGTLSQSDQSNPTETDGHVIRKKIGFNTNYAAAVHERTDLHHAVGNAKFLERAMSQNAQKFRRHIEAALRDV